ncbi:hypothetical protein, variant [Aphanomyces invadans]|nr:hypothetical protein, variant [Aphanomyces invadans]ETV97155.1 hypothetical protein, variant [Aphanomyces invadans]|eukprot:XP_008874401.1 hypothetical protein, variant [Aphanomyces invadans]
MHVQCRDDEAAKALLQVGLACGFRESGVVLGNKRTMVAIRTTANAMEIPIALHGNLMVNTSYLEWILDIANQKFHANRAKTDKLFATMLTSLFNEPSLDVTEATAPSSSLTTIRKLRVAKTSTLVVSRAGHTAVVGPQRKLCIVGGQGPTATNTTRQGDLILYDMATQVQSAPIPLNMAARMYHAAVYSPTLNRMLVFGGRASPTKPFGDLWAIDVDHGHADFVQTQGPAPSSRWSHTCSWVDGKLVVVGGRDATTVFSDVFALSFDTTPPTWHALASCADGARRFRHSAVSIGHSIYLFGGWQGLDTHAQLSLNSVDSLNTATGEWMQSATTGAIPPARASAAACVVDGQHVLLLGGTSPTAPCHDQVFSLDLSKMKWKQWPSLPSDALLVNHTMSYDDVSKTVHAVGGSCQCFGFGAVYSPAFALQVETSRMTALSKNTRPTKQTNDGLLVVAVPKLRVKAIKTLVEDLQVYDKSRRVQPIAGGAESFAVPVMDGIRDHASLPGLEGLLIAHMNDIANVVQPKNSGTDKVSAAGELVATGQIAELSSPPPAEVVEASKQPLLYAVLVSKDQVKAVKTRLETIQLYDKTRRIHPQANDMEGSTKFAVPVTLPTLPSDDEVLSALEVVVDGTSVVKRVLNPTLVVHALLQAFATAHGLDAVAAKFEFISDVLVLPKNTFMDPVWMSDAAMALWRSVCDASPVPLQRVARSADVDANEKRQSHVEVLYMHPSFVPTARGKGWVEVRENGLVYGWDLEKVMFSSGNVTEKARMAKIGCAGETIVDMYAGIGYYVVPFLVHGKAAYVHALEWNPDSVAALQFNLEKNHVASKCTVHPGDNRITGPTLGAIADRVNLGLLPKSEHGWPIAVQVLKHTGGWLHVHENVAIDDVEPWREHVVKSIREMGAAIGKVWVVECTHVERVKSYAPKVLHVVADVHCRPT